MARLVSPTQEKMDKLLVYLARKIGEHKPKNVVFFIVDILCTYYPQHIPSFSKIWLMDKSLDEQKQYVCDLFRRNHSTSCIAQHFINAGFDNLDVLTALNTDILDEIQAYNDATWLPGHKIRIFQIFKDIKKLVKEFKDELKSQRVVWHHGEGPVYKQMDGTHFAQKGPTAIKVGANTTIVRPPPVYYYPKVRTSTTIGAPGQQLSTITSTVQTKQPGENVYISNTMTMSQLTSISAEAAKNKVIDELINRAEKEDKEGPATSSASCCYVPPK